MCCRDSFKFRSRKHHCRSKLAESWTVSPKHPLDNAIFYNVFDVFSRVRMINGNLTIGIIVLGKITSNTIKSKSRKDAVIFSPQQTCRDGNITAPFRLLPTITRSEQNVRNLFFICSQVLFIYF